MKYTDMGLQWLHIHNSMPGDKDTVAKRDVVQEEVHEGIHGKQCGEIKKTWYISPVSYPNDVWTT